LQKTIGIVKKKGKGRNLPVASVEEKVNHSSSLNASINWNFTPRALDYFM
jgi:hypothetical protein